MTNGDKIRSMTDNELIGLFCEIRYGDYGMASEILDAMEESNLRSWLKKEIKTEKNNDTTI